MRGESVESAKSKTTMRPDCSRWRRLFVPVALIGCLACGSGYGGEPPRKTRAADSGTVPILKAPANGGAESLQRLPAAESAKLRSFLAGIIRRTIPEHYENEKDWGYQKRIYAGIKLRREGWKLETKRRWKEVNHGAWTRYTIDLIDPDKNLSIRLNDFNPDPKLASDSKGKAFFDLTISAPIKCFARRSRWNFGVQLWSFSVESDARVQVNVKGSVGLQFDYKNIPPDVLIVPEVQSATISVPEFEVQRISRIGGDLAEGIGDTLEALLRDEIVKRQNAKLIDKIRKQIDRKQDELRLSMSDWLSSILETAKPNDATTSPETEDSTTDSSD